MSLSYEQKRRLNDWSKRADRNCPMCHKSNVTFGELIPGLPLAGAGTMAALAGRFVQGTCSDCGHVMLFDRIIIGI